ncbi:MAG: lipoprotein-releasing system permease protein [Crocinitomicaceae bacterium]
MITRISVVGIATTTAALVILLSAFNGIESMIEGLYSEFDTDLTVRIIKGKSFDENRVDLLKIKKIQGVSEVVRAVEETVILKNEKKWVHAKMIGVDSNYLNITDMKEHMYEGEPYLHQGKDPAGIIGAGLLSKLDGRIPRLVGSESVICYVPKSNIRLRPGKSPFNERAIKISGSMTFNREVNDESFIIPLELGKELLGFDNQISALYIDAKEGVSNEDLKALIQKEVGKDFVVKTNFEKNELIYMTSKTERVIVMIILLFIFVLAAFNLVASLTMLFVEKLSNVQTMTGFGASRKFIFKIFFIEGLLISGKGIFIGLLLGYAVCFTQWYFHLIEMPNSNGEAFPIAFSTTDGVMIFSLVSILSILFSYFPVKYLIRKNIKAD